MSKKPLRYPRARAVSMDGQAAGIDYHSALLQQLLVPPVSHYPAPQEEAGQVASGLTDDALLAAFEAGLEEEEDAETEDESQVRGGAWVPWSCYRMDQK